MSDELISKESLERLAAKVRDEGWLESFKHVFEEEPHLVCFTLAMSTRLCLRLEACGVPMGLLPPDRG